MNKYLTTGEAAEILGISEHVVRRAVDRLGCASRLGIVRAVPRKSLSAVAAEVEKYARRGAVSK